MKRARPYYNTTHLSGEELRREIDNATCQEDVVLVVFRAVPIESLSPSQVLAACECMGKDWPITSIRRAITNLTNAGALVRLRHETRPGLYGKPETLWRLAGAAQ